MTIYRQQYEQIEIAVRSDFLTRLEASIRRARPHAFGNATPAEVRGQLNQGVNLAGTFDLTKEEPVQRFVMLRLNMGHRFDVFLSRSEVRRTLRDRHRSEMQRIEKTERLASPAKPA